ncbi:MAG: DoxX [Bacteriovoracaceae bacterium]|nr:DoxX [Bacteriovoracaceae bacterium]
MISREKLFSSNEPKSVILVRLSVGCVFLLEGILKFINPEELGVGRFEKIGFPFPGLISGFVGTTEIICGCLILIGLFTRLAAFPMIINMIVAILSTKLPMLLKTGFWHTAHEARLDFTMLLLCIFILLNGAGSLSVDHKILHGDKK